MKKIKLLSLVLASVLLLTNCKKKEDAPKTNTGDSALVVAEVNTPIYGKLTATWCGPCGAWGWTLHDEIIAAVESKAIHMGVYGSSSSNFTNSTVNLWFTDFGGQSYPNFTVNGVNKTVFPSPSSINPAQTKIDAIAAVDAFAAAPVEMSAAGKTSWDGQKLTVKAAVKAFKAQTGDFYVGAYMIEDKAKSIQASQTGTVEHHNVCRGSMSAGVYGLPYTGAVTAGTQTNVADFTFDVPSTWEKANVKVAIMIWKKVGSKFTFVNAAKAN